MVKVPCRTRAGAPEGLEEEIEDVLVERFVLDEAVLAIEDAEL